jgi:hypothetical protein
MVVGAFVGSFATMMGMKSEAFNAKTDSADKDTSE